MKWDENVDFTGEKAVLTRVAPIFDKWDEVGCFRLCHFISGGVGVIQN